MTILSRKHNLLSHLLIHSGEKPFKLQLCDKSFRTILVRHKKTHTGEKRHNCPSCDIKFSQLDGLKRHQKRVHPEDQPFKCEICSKSFMQLHQLRKHGIVHTFGDVIEDKDDSHRETDDKSGDRVENVSHQGSAYMRSQGREVLKDRTEIDDYWVKRYDLRDCYVKLQNFVNRLPDKAFMKEILKKITPNWSLLYFI